MPRPGLMVMDCQPLYRSLMLGSSNHPNPVHVPQQLPPSTQIHLNPFERAALAQPESALYPPFVAPARAPG